MTKRSLALALIAALPMAAEVDFSGEWSPRFYEDQPERVPGPELGDYLGMPLSEAGRMRATTWDASLMTLPEWQCRPHSADYIWRGPSPLWVNRDIDPVTREVTAIHAQWLRSIDRVIYMDGRPRPPESAPHTWAGFSTGKWSGNTLTITTTHLKEGYMRRNGVARSDKATLTEHWMRHGNVFTIVTIVNDPISLTEPFIRSTDYELDVKQLVPPYPCEMVQEIERPRGVVPHVLPGVNPQIAEFPRNHNLSPVATLGGAATMYPEYRDALKSGNLPTTLAPRPMSLETLTKPEPGEIGVQKVRDNLYMLTGGGGNVTLSAAPNGVTLLVDTGTVAMSDKLLAAIRKITPKPIRKIINTHGDPDVVGGNAKLAASGATITGGNVANDLANAAEGAAIVAHENVLNRMTNAKIGFEALPTETYHHDQLKLSELYNGDRVRVISVPNAHSDGDSIVYFHNSDVIVAGDLLSTESYPVIHTDQGGTVNGVIEGLNRILELAIPYFRMEGGTVIIPGKGRQCDSADVAYYRDMVTIVRDRVQDRMKKGQTLAQIKAAGLTKDWDQRYGNPDSFVEAIVTSLTPKKK
jgi:cyclase